MRVRIEGDGHCVEADCPDTNMDIARLAEITEAMWTRTKATPSRQQVGFGSQHVERTHDRPVPGDRWGGQVDPVTA